MQQANIKELNLQELSELMRAWHEQPFRARQIFSWVYKKGVQDFEAMVNLPVGLREKLKQHFRLLDLSLDEIQVSKDGTKKFLFILGDESSIEAVLIPQGERVTACISTQVGCKFACSFCASGLRGFKGNLTCAHMLEEVLYAKENAPDKRISHIVFMGTGEPFDNYDNVLKAIRIINADYSFTIGARRITISTCGIIPGIKRLVQEGLQVELSVSLHAANNALRSRLMPVNKKYPLGELIEACREYAEKTNRQVTFEYVLIKNINSDLSNARELSTIVKGFNCKVNLIPANAIKECHVASPSRQEVESFKNCLFKAGVHVTVRTPRGQDIDSACGQLRLRYENKPS